MNTIKITGTGLFAPGTPIDNKELCQLANIEFDIPKIESKLGIFQRHIAHLRGIENTTADFATFAAEQALKNANLNASDIDLIIVGTDTPEYITPSTSILVQGRLQGKEQWTATYDVAASCASFSIGLANAVAMMQSDNSINKAIVIGVYNMPAFIRPHDAFGYSIFADGAGAVVLQKTNDTSSHFIGNQMLTDGTQYDYIGIYAGGSKIPITNDILKNQQNGLLSLKPLPGDRNVRLWPMVIDKILKKYQLTIADVDHFIFTQINKSVIENVMDIIGVPLSKTTMVMDKYGYTGSGCIPMAMHHAVTEGKIKRGDKVLFVASGAGLAVGSNLFVY